MIRKTLIWTNIKWYIVFHYDWICATTFHNEILASHSWYFSLRQQISCMTRRHNTKTILPKHTLSNPPLSAGQDVDVCTPPWLFMSFGQLSPIETLFLLCLFIWYYLLCFHDRSMHLSPSADEISIIVAFESSFRTMQPEDDEKLRVQNVFRRNGLLIVEVFESFFYFQFYRYLILK